MRSYIPAYMVPGKAKIAIMLMPFQLHLQRSHDTMKLCSDLPVCGMFQVLYVTSRQQVTPIGTTN